MPAIVTYEEREAVARYRPITQAAITSFAKGEHYEDSNALIEELKSIAEITKESDALTTEPRQMQILRLDLELRFNRFVRDALPLLVDCGIVANRHDFSKDPLSYDNVPALVERLKLFLTQELLNTKGTDGGYVGISAIIQWRVTLVRVVVLYVQRHEQLETYDQALKKVLRNSPDGKQGVFYQLNNHVAHLINRYSLKYSKKAPGTYGAAEVQLLLNDMFKRLPCGVPCEPMLQRIILVQICFMTGLRIGSLAATDPTDKERHGIQQKHVSFETAKHGAWTLFLHITHLKGFNAAQDTMEFTVRMRPLEKASNILLEPAPVLLALLIQRRALRADGPDGPIISSIDHLLASSSYRFVGVGDEPLFQLEGSHLSVRQACHQLQVHTLSVGLPYASFHRLRKDFATQMQILFGSDVARELLHHNVQGDALNRHYTGGVALFDLIGLRVDETDQPALLQASNREDAIITGFAHRCVAIAIQAASSPTNLKNLGDTLRGSNVPSLTFTRKERRTHKDQVKFGLENSSTFAELYRQYMATAPEVEQLVGMKLPFSRYPPNKKVEKALRVLAIMDPSRFKEADAAWKVLQQLRTKLQKAKDSANQIFGLQRRKAAGKATAGGTSAPVTRDSMQKSREVLQPRRPELPISAGVGTKSSNQYERLDAWSNQLAASTPGPSNRPIRCKPDGGSDSDSRLVDGLEQLQSELNRRQDEADGHDETFNQAQVLEGAVFEEAEDGRALAEAIRFRIEWMRFLEGVSYAHERESKLLSFIVEVGFCPFCPFGPENAFPVARSKEQVGLFAAAPPPDQTVAHSFSNPRRHLAAFHPNELTALRAGKKLNPGVCQSPLVPVHVPNIYFQADPKLAAEFLAPASLPGFFDKLDEAQELMLVKYMEPTLYVDPDNQSQVDWADRVVGKLLTSQNEPETKETGKVQCEKLSASYDWPQRNPLFSGGPFNGSPGYRYPLPAMTADGPRTYGEFTSTRINWEGDFARACDVAVELVSMPMQ